MLAQGSAVRAPRENVFDAFDVALASSCFEAWLDEVDASRRDAAQDAACRELSVEFASEVQELRDEFCQELLAIQQHHSRLQNEVQTSAREEADSMACATRLENQVLEFHAECEEERTTLRAAVHHNASLEDEVNRLRAALAVEQESLFEASLQGRQPGENGFAHNNHRVETTTAHGDDARVSAMWQEMRRECQELQRQRDEARMEREEMRIDLAVALCSSHSPRAEVATSRSQVASAAKQQQLEASLTWPSTAYGHPASPGRKARLEVRRPAANGWRTPPTDAQSSAGSERGWIDDRRARVPALILPSSNASTVAPSFRSTSPLRSAAAQLNSLEHGRDQMATAGFLVRRSGTLS